MADNTVTTRIPRQLIRSDTHGKGAAEIGWGSPGDFARCQAFMRRHNVPGHEIDGACANLHKLATGEWPGRNAHKGAHALDDVEALVAAMGPKFKGRRWSGPLAPIGSPTGDGRQFPAGVLTYQTFPMPLAWQEKGLPGHQGAVTVGVIEHAEEKEIDGKRLIWGHGYMLDPKIIPDVLKAEHLIEHGVAGASVDLDSYTAVVRRSFDGSPVAHAAKGRIRSATVVRIPAFSDLRLQFDDEEPDTSIVASVATFAVNAAGWRGAPIAPREATFDADDAAKRIEAWANGDPNQMAKMFLWVDTENGPLLGRKGYRLPWGDIIDNKPYLIYHAIYAAAALLQDAHGGLPNIPDEQKGQLRTVITEIYQKLAKEFGDPGVVAPWDHHDEQQQQASGFRDPEDEYPEDNDDDDEFLETEEYAGRYTEHKHPRWPGKPGGRTNPARNPKGGEWTDVKGHGPHGQIKVGGKWVYPPKKGEKGYKNPEAAVRAKAKRGAGKSGGHSETRVVKKAKAKPEPREHKETPAPAARKPEPHKAPEAKAAPEAKKTTTTVAKKPRAHKVSAAQDKFLAQFRDNETVEADENNATVRVLEREGYIEKTGGTPAKKIPGKKVPAKRTPAKKTGGEKVSKDDTGGEGQDTGSEGGTPAKKIPGKKVETQVAKKTPAREKTLRQYRLTQKGRDHLGLKGSEGPKKEAPQGPEKTSVTDRLGLRMVRDRGDDGMPGSDRSLTPQQRETLASLESRGLLEKRKHGRQDRYHITDSGHEALKGHESEEPEGPPQKKEVPGSKTKVARKTGGPKEHKLTHAQQQGLESMRDEGWAPLHPGTRKVLEREGYVGSDGRLTQKGRDHLGIKGDDGEKKRWEQGREKVKQERGREKVAEDHLKKLDQMKTRAEVATYTRTMTRQEMLDILDADARRDTGVPSWGDKASGRNDTRDKLWNRIIQRFGGAKEDSQAIFPGNEKVSRALKELKGATTQEEAEKIIKDLNKAELIEVHEKLGAPKPQWQGTAGVYRDSIINHIESDAKASRRRAAERERVAKLERERNKTDYDRRLEEADALARKSSVNPHILADVVDKNGWSDVIKEDTGPLGIPVRNFLISQGIDSQYLIKSGRVIRRDGIVYLVEDHPTDNDHERRFGMLEAAIKALPEDARKYQKSFVWARGTNPSDAYWQKRFNNPNHTSLAMAGAGHTTVWRNGSGYSQERLIEPLRHEFGHNVDYEAKFLGIGSGSNYYQDLAQQDGHWLEGRGGAPRDFVPHPLIHHPLQFLPDAKREVPYGVTVYGKSSWGEDFAESMALYLMGEMGHIVRDGKRIPVYFRDMFPGRAKVMDRLFPKVGDQQLDLVAKRGPLPD